MVYHHLEGRRGVSEAKEHNSGFEQSFMCEKGHFPLVTWFDVNIIVSPMYVKFGK